MATRFFAAAVLLQGLLLLLPVSPPGPGSRETLLEVMLTKPVSPPDKPELATERIPESTPPPDKRANPFPALPPTDKPSQDPESLSGDSTPVQREQPAPDLIIDELLKAVRAMDWSVAEAGSAAIGRSLESDIVKALRRPAVALNVNDFDGTVAPSTTEIMDRWLSPGGEHNVVVRAPNGRTYCGRQRPADDLRPWLQMPMMFHECPGGGRRRPGPPRNN